MPRRKRADTKKGGKALSGQEVIQGLMNMLGGVDPNLPAESLPRANQANPQVQAQIQPQQAPQIDPSALNPVDKIGFDVANKALKKQAEEAVQQVGPEAILSSILQKNTQSFGQAAGAGVGQQAFDPTQSFAKPPVQQAPTQQSAPSQDQGISLLRQVLGGALQGFASGAAPNLASSRLAQSQTDLNRQKLAGQAPLQIGEREKLEAEISKDLLKQTVELSKAGSLKPNDIFSKHQDASKPFIDIRDSFDRMRTSLLGASGEIDFENAPPGSDLDILFGTAKTLDPSGRVTDSDVAIQEGIAGKYGDRIAKIFRKFQRKGLLLPGERKILFEAAQKRFISAERQQKKTTSEFEKLARQNNIDPRNVITDVGINLPQQQSQGSPFTQDQIAAEIARRGL